MFNIFKQRFLNKKRILVRFNSEIPAVASPKPKIPTGVMIGMFAAVASITFAVIVMQNHSKVLSHEYFQMALDLQAADLHEEALVALNEIIKLGKNNRSAAAYYCKGKSLLKLGRYEESVEAFQKATNLDPKDNISFHYKGEALLALGRLDECKKAIDKALALDPEYKYMHGVMMAYIEENREHERKKKNGIVNQKE